MADRWVYPFRDVADAEAQAGSWEATRALLGGKGANLGDMTRLGVPVPPGFTVTTEACNAYLAEGNAFPAGLWEQELEALAAVEEATGKRFGDPAKPLLISCRSGAKFSMPGMMDTILNLGLNDDVAAGLEALTADERFVWDAYRRLVQMFGSVVLGVPDEVFEAVITATRNAVGARVDADLRADDWREVTATFKEIVRTYTGAPFPEDPYEQLRLATEAVFASWNGKRARDYREASGIAHDLGTAVNIQTMVFGNMGPDCATGVAMSRDATTGEPTLEGDFLVNAQGEDVVAGIRATQSLDDMQRDMPDVYEAFRGIADRLERHYRNMQDMEFTIEHGTLWILQTRDGKRTAQAEVRIAVDMAEEGLITRGEAVRRVSPDQVDVFLHPQFTTDARERATKLATGLNVSPGAAVGDVAFDADTAERWAKEGRAVVMVRPETKPDDVHGMLAAQGILTSRGGRTSHAALVARQFGKPAVVGVADLEIDLEGRTLRVGEHALEEGDPISLDGTLGEVFEGALDTVVPDLDNPYLATLLGWADDVRTLGVRANADYPEDAAKARTYGAEGLGLVRTEHMFFETERIGVVQRMILARSASERAEALDALLPYQREDFAGLFRAMDGLPVVIRLLDPPLHEFLPDRTDLTRELADLKVQLQHQRDLAGVDALLEALRLKQDQLVRVEELHEANPMLGTRGVRLGILMPELVTMQVRAIFEAACDVAAEGVAVDPEIMIPLTSHVRELTRQMATLEAEAKAVMSEREHEVAYRFGTMIEVPRAALTAGELAEVAEFFSFGTNDLTQTTFGISRDDAEKGFLLTYLEQGLLDDNPFTTIDEAGVGYLVRHATEAGRAVRPDLEVGICGEHGGDPATVAFCHRTGLSYVSCSPFRVPIARLAAAHAALDDAASTRADAAPEDAPEGAPEGAPVEA
ncbi:MAG: pyruvate, phosphate dikinase [Trueperaceae bacterium]|nr:pyruvate, phosphate dikinase [Trueperaceae bacterium]